MSFPPLTDLVGKLASAYPRQKIDRKHYEAELADVPLEVLAAAVRRLIRAPGEWLPSVGDVRAECAGAILGLPSEQEAAAQVEARMRWAREGRHGDRPEVHPLVRAAIDHVGGWHNIRSADRPEVVRGQMLRYFREARDQQVRDQSMQDFHRSCP